MSPWRFVHFLALAYVAMLVCRKDHPFFASRWARPFVLIGQSSLQMFCLGVFLSFVAHFILVELNGEFGLQLTVNAVGVGIMLAVAVVLNWYKTTERERSAQRRRPIKTAEGMAQ
jgi:hypothetical protein